MFVFELEWTFFRFTFLSCPPYVADKEDINNTPFRDSCIYIWYKNTVLFYQ
jgi:hypothetical protein